MPLYLLNRNGTYYYHRRIPSHILQANPTLKPVLRISLGTGRKSEAKPIAHRLNVMFDDFAKQYFETPEEYAEARVMLQRFEHATCLSSLTTKDINKFFEKYGSDAAEKIGKARRVIELQKSEMVPAQLPASQIPAIKADVPGELLSELVDEFIENQRRKNGWKVGNHSEDKYRHALKCFVDLVNKPSDKLEKGDLVKVKNLLLKLPDIRKFRDYKGMSIKELYNVNVPSEHRISNNTIKQHADRIVTFVTWLYDNDYCRENLSKTLQNIVKTTRKQGKDVYTEEQLKVLFNPHEYKKLTETQYWIPLIALHTGARINEICQLDTQDIREKDGIWIIDINEDSDKRVKREASKRIIPIHHRLKELGFLEYVKLRDKKKLFDVTYTIKNGYSGSMGSWWGRWQKQQGVEGNVSFHTFRKTVITYFNQTLELPEIAHAYYTGHAPQGNEGLTTYTKEKPLPDAKVMFDKLVYDIDYEGLKRE